MQTTIIKINNLQINVNIGNSQQERIEKQQVNFNIELCVEKKPKACETDNLEDTICYGNITNLIQDFCYNKEFKLIEYLGYQTYLLLKNNLNNNIKIKLNLTKFSPPIKGYAESVSFEYSDY